MRPKSIFVEVVPVYGEASKHDLRVRALPGQGVSTVRRIRCPLDVRDSGAVYKVEVHWTAGTERQSYPYIRPNASFESFSREAAEAEIARSG